MGKIYENTLHKKEFTEYKYAYESMISLHNNEPPWDSHVHLSEYLN